MMRTISRAATALGFLSMLSISFLAWAVQGTVADAEAIRAPVAQIGPKVLTREEYMQRRIYENELMNQRLNWLLASQSLLFAGYGAILSASLQQQIKERVAKAAVTLGASSAFLIWLGIIAAIGASVRLTERFGDKDFLSGLLGWTNLLGWSVPFLLPLLFIGAWVNLPTSGLTSTSQNTGGL